MGDNPCTVGSLRAAFATNLPPPQVAPNPILQVLQVKPIQAQPGAPERYRVVLSDTLHFIQAMVNTQANHLINSGDLGKGCFIQLTNYNAQMIKDKKILMIVELTVLKDLGTREKIGTPTALEGSTPGQSSAAPPQQEAASATSFYGNKQHQRTGPLAAAAAGGNGYEGGAETAASTTHPTVYPIEAVSPYQSKWTIKARVTHKSEIKTWSNSKSEGRLFTVHFLDETGEIRATGFNQEVDQFYEVLQEGQVYYVSKCRVNMAKKQFSTLPNDYELTFNRETEIERCEDDSVPKANFHFVPLSELGGVEKDATVDVLCVIKEVGDLEEIISKSTSKPHSKRNISVVDGSDTWVRCTVWGNQAKTWEVHPGTVVAFKGVKVGDYGGRTLSTLYSSTVMVNPDTDDAHVLKGWYDGQGQRDLSTYKSHAGLGSSIGGALGRDGSYKTLAQLTEEHLGESDDGKPDYFTAKATIVYIKHESVAYPACMKETCNKKVIPIDDESWNCQSCNETFPKPQYRYILTISVNDASGQAWLNCFDDVGRVIMGKSADELMELKDSDERAFDACFAVALGKTYIFRCRAKPDNYMGQTRVRYQVLSAASMNYAVEAAKLVDVIKLYNL